MNVIPTGNDVEVCHWWVVQVTPNNSQFYRVIRISSAAVVIFAAEYYRLVTLHFVLVQFCVFGVYLTRLQDLSGLLYYHLQQVPCCQLQKMAKERGKEEVVVSSYPFHASALTS